jgi:hypothetical protein
MPTAPELWLDDELFLLSYFSQEKLLFRDLSSENLLCDLERDYRLLAGFCAQTCAAGMASPPLEANQAGNLLNWPQSARWQAFLNSNWPCLSVMRIKIRKTSTTWAYLERCKIIYECLTCTRNVFRLTQDGKIGKWFSVQFECISHFL